MPSPASSVSPLQQAFFQRLGSRLGQAKAANLPPFASWVEKHVVLPSGPFRFQNHEFLRGIYADEHEHRCFRKGSQMGLSTHVLSRSAYLCRNRFRNGVIYFMPTDSQVNEFSKGIVDPFFELNPGLLASGAGAVDSVQVKRLGFSHLYFRGLKTTLKAKSIPADMIIFDEVDEIPSHARKSAMQRIEHSSFGYIDELSIPSIPEYGVDETFQKSDQRHWVVKCEGCRAEHILEEEFPSCLLRHEDGTVTRICVKCGKEVDVNAGRWVAKFPGRDIHGYGLSQIFAPWVNPTDILNEFEAGKDLDVFHNERLGLPYVEAENELKREQVLQLCGSIPRAKRGQEEVVAGIDQGKDLHVWLWSVGASGSPRCVGIEVFRDEKDARDYLRQFRLVGGVIDALPETRVAQKFVEWFPGKFFKNFYRELPARQDVQWDETRSTVVSDRTHTLDSLYDLLRSAGTDLPRRDAVVEEAAQHFFNLKKKRVKSEDQTIRYVYVRTGPDHWAHAANYGLSALERFKVRHVKGAAYKGLSDDHIINPISLPKIDTPVDVHFALVPHDRLPWVGVWAAVDRAGVVAFVREEEFDGVTLATFARRLSAAEATDPKEPVDRYIPSEYAEMAQGNKELTFLERLEDADPDLQFSPVDVPDSLAVVKIREAMAMKSELANPVPGLLVARDCPGVIEGLRMHRPGVAINPDNDVELRLSMYHKAVAMIVIQDPQVHREGRGRR